VQGGRPSAYFLPPCLERIGVPRRQGPGFALSGAARVLALRAAGRASSPYDP